MFKGPWAFLAMCGLAASFVARADGPHWQVPNPDGEPYRQEEDQARQKAEEQKKAAEKKQETEKKKGGVRVLPPVGFANPRAGSGHDLNPGDFITLDEACIRYYEQNCAISFDNPDRNPLVWMGGPKKAAPNLTLEEKKRRFYVAIMHRCAQAMREVDTYLPCPDSYPLWHEAEGREKMVEYAGLTWVRATQLPQPYADACLKCIAECYVDTVRFSDDAQGKRLPGNLKPLVELNNQLAGLLAKIDAEPDVQKKAVLMTQWRMAAAQVYRLAFSGNPLAAAYASYKLVTGDIPLSVGEAESRMMKAIVEMGPSMIPYLTNAPHKGNVRAMKAVATAIELIRRRALAAAPTEPSGPVFANTSTVPDLVRWIERKPNSEEARAALAHLKRMGPGAFPHLLRIAENDALGLKKTAAGLLAQLLERPAGTPFSELKRLAEERLTAEKTQAEAAAKKEASEENPLVPGLKKDTKKPVEQE